ncbi:class I SAM-dependent methyltransferase [Paenibacillus sp. MAHUQ-46]|uniref:Class I SAM-dependent methyltransferase n=1 Tax=Paenibacillus roseus TaxID=2798579 RepID=A0A934J5N0_9BACL|nr:class I SAM-dependent methyltransferase [Paenibacillus roseus]
MGKTILCLASGGGQQGPILSAAGANVTVFDYSLKQLQKDEWVAKRDGLQLKTVQGDMRDLSIFEDESFDVIVHPWSNGFVDSVLPVWREAYRVLKKGGALLSGFGNPVEYIFDVKALNQGEFVVRHSIPYSDLTGLSKEEFEEVASDGILFGHTLHDQIQGQIDAGFLIAGFYEDKNGTALDRYIDTSIATRAIKY